MRTVTVAACGLALAATTFSVADGFRLGTAKTMKLGAGSVLAAESKATLGRVGADKRSISFTSKSVHLVVRTGPETDMLSFRIQGLRNPTIYVRPGASVTVLFVNTDGDMLHDFRLTAKRPPFEGGLGNSDSVGSEALPHAEGKGFFGEQLTFKAPLGSAVYSYVCTIRGHAPGGTARYECGEEDIHMTESKTENEKFGRRQLLRAGGMVAGLGLLGRTVAWGSLKASGEAADQQNWPAGFEPDSTTPKYMPRAMPKEGEAIHVFDIEITIGKHEIVPGIETHMFLFNGTFPGPEIRVKEGDWVQVNLTNHSPESHTIHWHGIQVPCEMDGVPLGTQWPVMQNQTFRYLWRAQPAGTHFYHCHVMTTLHTQAGLVGSLVIEAKDDPIKAQFPYDREYTLLLSEIDTNFVRDFLNEMVAMGSNMEKMNHNARLMREMNGRMMGWFKDKEAFLKAVKEGYIPPYMSSMTGLVKPITPNFFMINGKSYPMTEAVMIRRGETIRVRLIGAGAMPHYMHLHGHDFWHVAQDGSALASPVRLNTIPVNPGSTADIVIQGTNAGNWHFHDHSDMAATNNGQFPGGMMTMLMYEDAKQAGFMFDEVISLSS